MLTYKDLLFTGPEAVCIVDSELKIRQHNQLLSLLLGDGSRKLTGQHLSNILHDDILIRHLLSSDGDSGWFQGECTLRLNINRPLVVKFRAGPVMDEDLLPNHHEITDIIYHPSEKRFLPYSADLSERSKLAIASASAPKVYVLIFREREETQHLSYERRVRSLQFLMNAVAEQDMELEDILLNFAREFDQYAEVMLLPPDSDETDLAGRKPPLLLPQPAIETALDAMREKTVTWYSGESLWYFFPVYSQNEAYGIATIKFSISRLYSEEDRSIFSLAGRTLGRYVETSTSGSQVASSHPLFDAVLNEINCSVVVVDRKGIITLCNAAAEKTYGHTASEMIGASFGHMAFPANGTIQYEELLDYLMRGEPIRYEEIPHICSGATIAQVSLSAYPYKLDNDLVVGGIFITRDLREKRRLRDKMMQWEKLSALGEILASVANELNNPLTSLTGYSHLLLNRKNDTEVDSMASTIYEEAKRCSEIVHGVLDLARDDETRKESAHVNSIIIAALDLKRHQLLPNNIEVRMDLGEDIPGVIVESRDVERLFLRIINYAERRMMEYDDGGQLTVESAFEDGNVVIRFGDTGTCVLQDDIAEILDPFSTAGEDEGVELGLSISCQILRNMGGSIRVDSEIGKGNVFTIVLPVAKEAAPHMLEQKAETDTFALETGKRILVVDDEPAIVELLAEILQHMGYVADIAADGSEAMKKLETETYDLIIADLRMPFGFTGEKLHKFIELKDPELAQKIIFITGDVINPETLRFLQSTGNLYLEKPFPPESLQEAIRISLGKRSAE